MAIVIKRRWSKFKSLLAYKYFLTFYYEERLIDYPLSIAIKMLLSRLVFLSQLPLLLPDHHFLVNCHGSKMYIDLNTAPIMMDMAFGVYEYWKTQLFFEFVKDGMTILDIGAYKGNYSILFAKLMHNRGKVLAFEPDPDNCNWLSKNIQVNNYKCIEIYQCALSNKEGAAIFYPGDGMGSLVPSHSSWMPEIQRGPITVQTRMLDNVLNKENIGDVHIIKMDVEGADLQVLKGAEHTLRSNNVQLFMDVDVTSNAERKELFELLESYGYEIYRLGREVKPIKKANELFLFSEDIKSTFINWRQPVREIYAIKSE